MPNYWPEPKQITPDFREVTMHHRSRVVVHGCDRDGALATAEALSETHACDLETFVSWVDNRTNEPLGEVIVGREFYPCKGAMMPAEPT